MWGIIASVKCGKPSIRSPFLLLIRWGVVCCFRQVALEAPDCPTSVEAHSGCLQIPRRRHATVVALWPTAASDSAPSGHRRRTDSDRCWREAAHPLSDGNGGSSSDGRRADVFRTVPTGSADTRGSVDVFQTVVGASSVSFGDNYGKEADAPGVGRFGLLVISFWPHVAANCIHSVQVPLWLVNPQIPTYLSTSFPAQKKTIGISLLLDTIKTKCQRIAPIFWANIFNETNDVHNRRNRKSETQDGGRKYQ